MKYYCNYDCDSLYDAYKMGKADGRKEAIEEFVKAIEKRQTRQDNYLDPPYFEMGLDITDVLEVAEQLRSRKNESNKK